MHLSMCRRARDELSQIAMPRTVCSVCRVLTYDRRSTSPPLHVGELLEELPGGGGGRVGHGTARGYDSAAAARRRGAVLVVPVAALPRALGRVGVLQLQRVLEVPQHVAHGDAVAAELGEALLGGLGELGERLRVDGAGELGVHDLLDEALALPLHAPLRQADLLPGQLRVDGGPRAQRLQQHHAEGVHVGLVRQLLAPEVLRVQVPEAALHGGAHVQLVHPGPVLGQPEVRHLGHEVVVQQDVGGLHVAVDDPLRRARVQVVQPPGSADADLQPLLPRQRRLPLAAVDVVPEHAVVHVLVHQDHLLVLVAVADQGHQVPVPQLGQHLDLRVELVDALLRLRAPALHRHLGAVVDLPDVHVAEPAHADDGLLVEVLGGRLDLREREEAAQTHGGGEGVAALGPVPAALAGEGLARVDGEQPRREALPPLPVLRPLVPLHHHGAQPRERAEHHGEPDGRHRLAPTAPVVGLLPVHAKLAVQAAHGVAHLQHLHAVEQRVDPPRVLPHGPDLDAQLAVLQQRRVHHEVLVVGRRQLAAGHRRQVQPGHGLAPADVHVEVEVVGGLAHDVGEEEADQVAEGRVHVHLPRQVEVGAPHVGVRHPGSAGVHQRRRHQPGRPFGEPDGAGGHRHVLHRLLGLHVRGVGLPPPAQRVLGRADGGTADVDPVQDLVRVVHQAGDLAQRRDGQRRVGDELVGRVHHLDGVDEGGGATERLELERQVVLGGVHQVLVHDGLVPRGEAVEQDVVVGDDAKGHRREVHVAALEREEVEADEVPARDGEREAVDGLLLKHPRGGVQRRGHVGLVVGGDADGVGGGEQVVGLRVRLVRLAVGGEGRRPAAVDQEAVFRREAGRRGRRLRAAVGHGPALPGHGCRRRRQQ
uniref:Uncharacterized protein n=1 Tax=Zea mays TaxID=4577 RepID=A0A804QYF7_MAIZE